MRAARTLPGMAAIGKDTHEPPPPRWRGFVFCRGFALKVKLNIYIMLKKRKV